jgi:hypothetical protein
MSTNVDPSEAIQRTGRALIDLGYRIMAGEIDLDGSPSFVQPSNHRDGVRANKTAALARDDKVRYIDGAWNPEIQKLYFDDSLYEPGTLAAKRAALGRVIVH